MMEATVEEVQATGGVLEASVDEGGDGGYC